jgi:hypothetical protein
MYNSTVLYKPNDYEVCTGTAPCQDKTFDLINMKTAWDFTRGDSCIKIGITDAAFEHHADLDDKIFNLGSLPAGVTVYSASTGTLHGTLVAGLAAAKTDNDTALAGTGFNCRAGYYGYYTMDWVLKAALDGCKVVNCSWYNNITTNGGPGSSYDQGIVDMLYSMNVTVVAAAGNGDTYDTTLQSTYYYPASLNHVISVTTVGSQNPIGFSVYDPFNPIPGDIWANWYDCHREFLNPYDYRYNKAYNHNDSVDICAPGYWDPVLAQNNDITADGGTSLSSPIVAGVVALLYDLNPNYTVDQITHYIKASAHPIDTISYNAPYAGRLGAGRLDAGAALAMAVADGYTCKPSFTDIVWKRMGHTGWLATSNNYDFFSEDSIQFSTSTSAVSGATKEWDFVYTHGTTQEAIYHVVGTNPVLKFSDFVSLYGYEDCGIHAPTYCCNRLDVYVRQSDSSNCCFGPYYKETTYDSSCIYIRKNTIVKQPKLSVYPSPAQDVLNIMIEQQDSKQIAIAKTGYQLISADGRVVATGRLMNTVNTIDIHKLAKGIYFIKTNNMGSTSFVKQ